MARSSSSRASARSPSSKARSPRLAVKNASVWRASGPSSARTRVSASFQHRLASAPSPWLTATAPSAFRVLATRVVSSAAANSSTASR
jgi:hypothetical protein